MENATFKLKHLKTKLDGHKLDLSMCQLPSVPVKEIHDMKKVTELDLSRNRLQTLPKEFASLSNIVELDLSSNTLESLIDEFGNLSRLQRLDLYKNQLTDLPLSFCKLKHLKWLDMKGNPLNDQLRLVAGDFSNEKDCRQAATKVVQYMQKRQSDFERERQKRLITEKEKEQAKKSKEEAEKKLAQLEKKKQKEIKKKPANGLANSKDFSKIDQNSNKDNAANIKSGQELKNAKNQQKRTKKSRRTCARLICNMLLTLFAAIFFAVATTAAIIYVSCTQPDYSNLLPDNSALCDDIRHTINTGQLRLTWNHQVALQSLIDTSRRLADQTKSMAMASAKTVGVIVSAYFDDILALVRLGAEKMAREAPFYYDHVTRMATNGAQLLVEVLGHAYEILERVTEYAGRQTRMLVEEWPAMVDKVNMYWKNLK